MFLKIKLIFLIVFCYLCIIFHQTVGYLVTEDSQTNITSNDTVQTILFSVVHVPCNKGFVEINGKCRPTYDWE